MIKYPKNIHELYEWTRIKGSHQNNKYYRFNSLLRYFKIAIPSSKVIKIAGTNGKGSVAAMLEAMILEDQKTVVLFTSPHLYDITERFRINGQEIKQEILDSIAQKVALHLLKLVGEQGDQMIPSFFEILTILALKIFELYQADLVILEAGIGGYNDIVHLIPGDISTITSIGLDHTDKLGSTVTEIAADKVGIASPHSTLILGLEIPNCAKDSILKDAQQRNIKLVQTQKEDIQFQSLELKGHEISIVKNSKRLSFRLPLVGSFQVNNFITAKAVIEELIGQKLINDFNSLRGVSKVRWPGRMEVITGEPNWLLDTAHNVHAMRKVIEELPDLISHQKVCILFGLSDHNEPNNILPYLKQLSKLLNCSIYLTSGFHRAIEPHNYGDLFYRNIPKLAILDNYKLAINHLLSVYKKQDDVIVFITGSLFLVGVCREYLLAGKNEQ